jgi:hypothetical protein
VFAERAEPGYEVEVGLTRDAADPLGLGDPRPRPSCHTLDLVPAGHQAAGPLVGTTTILLDAPGRMNDS